MTLDDETRAELGWVEPWGEVLEGLEIKRERKLWHDAMRLRAQRESEVVRAAFAAYQRDYAATPEGHERRIAASSAYRQRKRDAALAQKCPTMGLAGDMSDERRKDEQ